MIISRAEIASAIAVYRTVKRKSGMSTVVFDTADRYDSSETAVSLSGFVQNISGEPFYRPELVEDLQQRIAEGRYYVPTEDIVEKMIGRLILDFTTAN